MMRTSLRVSISGFTGPAHSQPVFMLKEPSTMLTFLLVPRPLEEITKPLFRPRPLSSLPALVLFIPGTSTIMDWKLRPLTSMRSSWEVSMVPLTSPVAVLTWAPAATTSTDCSTAPISRVRLWLMRAPGSSFSPETVRVLKPDCEALRLLVPSVAERPVSRLVTTTWACGMTLPLGSVTTPVMLPVEVWLSPTAAAQAAPSTQARHHAQKDPVRMGEVPPLARFPSGSAICKLVLPHNIKNLDRQ